MNCNFAAWHGELRVYYEHRVIRTDRPNGTGYIVDAVSIPPTPALRRHTEAFARHFDYTGVGCAQFLVDPQSGAIAFLELNPRLDASCSLPFACGYDFPLLALEIARRRAGDRADLPAAGEYRVGVRGNWLLGDLKALRKAARSRIDGAPPTLIWLGARGALVPRGGLPCSLVVARPRSRAILVLGGPAEAGAGRIRT